ncbi:MAG: AAA family ATPase [Desulfobacterales bacterium]|nr:AAA family ATPase [Desulfobacterales bacterium]
MPHKKRPASGLKRDSIPIPPGEPDFWIAQENLERLNRIATRSEKGEQVNVLISGSKGCGKTTMAREFAARFQRPFHEVHCGAFIDNEQWFGKDRLDDGVTWYRKSRFVQAIETPGAVVLLDEINRAHPEILSAILGLLDWRHSIWNDDLGYEIRVAGGVVFFATINEGDDYYGVNVMDAALRDRFSRTIMLDYMPCKAEAGILHKHGLAEDMALKLAVYANTMRKSVNPVPISTRQLLVTTEEMLDGATLRKAAETSIINALSDMTSKKMALEALQWLEDNPYVDENIEIIPVKSE